ncbi:MAG: hypothetical protein ABSC37_20845, partial [Xanthobacteraceae bacterium]
MSTDPLVAAVGRVEAAIGGDSSPHSPSLPSPVYGGGKINEPSPVYGGGKGGGCRDLIDVAAAIDRVEALIAAGTAQGPDGSAAAERVADIAFVLHEREVEASLCDALDAAAREICDACALNQAAAQRTHQAAELLHELSRRINDMIALSVADRRAEPPAAADAADAALASIEAEPEPTMADKVACEEATNDDIPPRARLVEADVQEDEDFTQAVAALAASLPSLADPAEPASDPRRQPADVIAEPPDHAKQPEPPAEADDARTAGSEAELPHSERSAEAMPVIESSSDAFLREQSLQATLASEKSSGEEFSGNESPIREIPSEALLNEKPSSESSSSENPASAETPSGWASRQESPGEDSANEDGPALPEPGVIMPAAPTDSLSHPAPQAPAGGDATLASQAVPLAGEANAAPGHSALTEPADRAPQRRAEPADFAVEQTAHDDVERDHETQLSGDAEQQGSIASVDRPSADADEVRSLLAAEPSRALLPESEPLVGPEEDPGDLFEPMATPPFAPPVEAVAPVVAPAPAPPSDLASNPEHTRSPSSESEPECRQDAQAAMNAPEAAGLGEVSSVDTAALALSASAAPDAEPPPQAPSP